MHGPVIRMAIGLLPLVLAATSSSAHHSFAMFDTGKCRTISGTVRAFQWNYPHSWIWIDVPNAKGGSDAWGFEGEPPTNLAQEGWKRDSVVKGEKITVAFNPLRDGRNGGAFSGVRRADGSVLTGALGKRKICQP